MNCVKEKKFYLIFSYDKNLGNWENANLINIKNIYMPTRHYFKCAVEPITAL